MVTGMRCCADAGSDNAPDNEKRGQQMDEDAPEPPKLGQARRYHTFRSTIIFLISAMALAGLRPFGQALAQFMMVWQR